jgi:hypothetical protein
MKIENLMGRRRLAGMKTAAGLWVDFGESKFNGKHRSPVADQGDV